MTRQEKKEEAIKRIMNGLKCSRAEAEAVQIYDEAVDHDKETEFDLPPEKARIAQKFAHTGTKERKKPFVPDLKPRERKPNATKGGIIAEIAGFIEKNSNFAIKNFQIPNKEGKIAFKIGEKWYTIALTEHRTKPKGYEGD